MQIVIVDDGSTDGTWEWLEKQPDVLALRQANQGQPWAVNHGQQHAVGTYIRFLDSDDYLAPGAIDRQFEAALATSADVIYGRVDSRDEETGVTVEYDDPPHWDDFTAVMLGEGYGSHFLGMLFRTSFVADVPRRPEFALREDRMFLLEVALRKPKISPVSGCIGYWIKHKQNMHDSYRGMQRTIAAWQSWQLYERILARLEIAGELTPRRARAAINVLWPLAHWIAYTHPAEAAEVAEWIYRLDPAFTPPEPGLLGAMYRHLGFAATERILRMRRHLLAPIRKLGSSWHEAIPAVHKTATVEAQPHSAQ